MATCLEYDVAIDRAFDRFGSGRYSQFLRVWTLIGLLRQKRRDCTVASLHREMTEAYGELSNRTVRRDLHLLERLGLAASTPRGTEPEVYRWTGCEFGQGDTP